MQKEYELVTDSSCDLPQSLADKFKLTIVPLTLTIDEKEYTNYLDESEISFKAVYDAARERKKISTSCPSVDSFKKTFENILKREHDILYIGFSSGLSATVGNAEIAAKILREKYPSAKIFIVDSLCASLGQGLFIKYVYDKAQTGCLIEEAYDYAEKIKLHICHWFTVDNLIYLKRGGRISAATAVAGTIINVKPVMHMDNTGHLVNVSKARGRRAAINALVEKIKESVTGPQNQTAFISHGDCEDEAKAIAVRLKHEIGFKDVIINYVGPVIGGHTGPGVIALFCYGNKR